jgi:hypothetical protein
LKGLGHIALNGVLQTPFNAANEFRGFNVWLGANKKLTDVVAAYAVSQDSHAIWFGRDFDVFEPLVLVDRALPPEQG